MQIDLSYIAGFFDGEGCIYIYHRKRGIQKDQYDSVFCITQKKPAILFSIAKVLSEVTHSHIKVYAEDKEKTKYSLRVYKKQSIKDILTVLLPFMQNKKQEAVVMLDYLNGKLSKQLAYNELRRLKK